MGVVLLVRHGQASAQGADYDVLSDLGRRQSEIIGSELRRRGVTDPVLLSGSLNRQRDTAALAWPDGAAQVDPRWNEYDHLGLLRDHGATPGPGSFQAALDAALARWIEAADPDGWTAFHHRVTTALQDLLAELPSGRDAVVFTSGGVLAATTAELLGGGAETVVALNRVAVNGGITKLTSRGALITFNEHTHLDGEGRTLLTYR